MMKSFLGICLLIYTASGWANSTWQCNNAVLLDLCQNASCFHNRSVAVSGKSLKISLDQNRNLSICTSASCWRGVVQPAQANNPNVLKLNEVRWKDPNDNANHYMLAINEQSKNLYFEGKQGKYPLQCTSV